MTEMFGEAWSPMSVPDLAPDDDEFKFIHGVSSAGSRNDKSIFRKRKNFSRTSMTA